MQMSTNAIGCHKLTSRTRSMFVQPLPAIIVFSAASSMSLFLSLTLSLAGGGFVVGVASPYKKSDKTIMSQLLTYSIYITRFRYTSFSE